MTYDNPCRYCSAPCEGERHATWQGCSDAMRQESLRMQARRIRPAKFTHMMDAYA